MKTPMPDDDDATRLLGLDRSLCRMKIGDLLACHDGLDNHFLSSASRCLTNFSSSSVCCAIRSAFRRRRMQRLVQPAATRFSACKLQPLMLTAAWGGFQFFDSREDGAAGLVERLVGLDERLRSAPTVVAASSIRYC